jgi:hypothetical protein
MKKLIFMLLSIFVIANLSAQDIKLIGRENYKTFSPTATDTVKGTTAGLTYSWEIPKTIDPPYLYDHFIELDSLHTHANIWVVLQGCYDINDTTNQWHTISSVKWQVSTGDTLIRFNNLAQSSTIGSHTITTTAFNIFAMDSILYDDTLHIPAITQTVAAQTVTKTYNGVYNYQRIYVFGTHSTSGVHVDKIRLAFIKPKSD